MESGLLRKTSILSISNSVAKETHQACRRAKSQDPLFWPYDKQREYSVYLHLAQIISLLGPPPRQLLDQSPLSPLLFNAAGT